MLVTRGELFAAVPMRIWLALGVLLLGVVLGIVVGRVNRRLLARAGVPEAIEGTAFERTAHELGTSTVALIAKLSTYFIVAVAVLAAITVSELDYADRFWNRTIGFLPQLFFGALVLIVGLVVADKVELLVADRLRGIKLPEANIIPTIAKYSVFYIAALIALSQVGVATLALVVLLGAYALALIFFSVVAFKHLLSAGAAGVYLLLNEPYGIGDEVKVGDRRGIVQEVDLFVTHVEADDEEHIIPNNKVFTEGIVRIL